MKEKYVYDAIWGQVLLTPLMQRFIDTYEFQRLKNIKQLGTAQFVYPGASNTRFEHSLGVSHLARKMASRLTSQQRLIDLISVAGLLHDIGHGPMSHTFDIYCEKYNFFKNPLLNKHEYRSTYIVRYMIEEYSIPLNYEETAFICNCIITPIEKSWEHSIVSNYIDVDRMDYIIRDSYNTGVNVMVSKEDILNIIDCAYIGKDRTLQFQDRSQRDIDKLLDSRKYMYSNVYHHKVALKFNDLVLKLMHLLWEKEWEGQGDLLRFLKVPFNDLLLEYYWAQEQLPNGAREIMRNIFHRKIN